MLKSKFEGNEKEIIKEILMNHGIDYIIVSSICKYLFEELQIQKKKYNQP